MNYFDIIYTEVLTYLGFFVVNPIACAYVAMLQTALLMSAGLIALGIYKQNRTIKMWKKNSIQPDKRWMATVEKISRRIGLSSLPGLRFTHQALPICTVGFFKPVIYIPEPMVRNLTDSDLAMIAEHELWHIKKRHNLKKLIMRSLGLVGSLWSGFATGLALTYRVLDQRYEIIGLVLSFILGLILMRTFRRYVIPYFDLWCEYECDDALQMQRNERQAMAAMLVRLGKMNIVSDPMRDMIRCAAVSHLEKRVRRLISEPASNTFTPYIRGVLYFVAIVLIVNVINIHREHNLQWVSGHGKRMHLCAGECK